MTARMRRSQSGRFILDGLFKLILRELQLTLCIAKVSQELNTCSKSVLKGES